MAAELVTELDSGTCTGWVHPHNGYFAGDFHPLVHPPLSPPPGAAAR